MGMNDDGIDVYTEAGTPEGRGSVCRGSKEARSETTARSRRRAWVGRPN